jgi:Xaa-Pro aminopeptidase
MARDLTKEEIELRLGRFRAAMDRHNPGWDTAVLVSRINQYYLTGTMQDGLLMIRPDNAWYFVRRSFERALDESPFPDIHPIQSYREAARIAGVDCGKTFIESEIMTVAILERFNKYFTTQSLGPLDKTILTVRALKTPYELAALEEAGRIHHEILVKVVPELLREGMSELELCNELFQKMMEHGHNGVTRFQAFQSEMGLGQIGFGTSSIYPTSHDGPGGTMGLSAAVPILGSAERRLKKGDTVFVDIGFVIRGYHSDKSQAYIFGAKPTAEMISIQKNCLETEKRTAALIKPGARPSDIYRAVMGGLSEDFKAGFMGYGARQVRFLGHGIGLHVDELPVLAEGFDDPLEENMVLAVEPKKGLRDVGLLGVEDTYVVTRDGGRCITGGGCDILEV